MCVNRCAVKDFHKFFSLVVFFCSLVSFSSERCKRKTHVHTCIVSIYLKLEENKNQHRTWYYWLRNIVGRALEDIVINNFGMVNTKLTRCLLPIKCAVVGNTLFECSIPFAKLPNQCFSLYFFLFWLSCDNLNWIKRFLQLIDIVHSFRSFVRCFNQFAFIGEEWNGSVLNQLINVIVSNSFTFCAKSKWINSIQLVSILSTCCF